MKYILFEKPNGIAVPILFPNLHEHKEVAAAISWKVLSAGKLEFINNNIAQCTTGSFSLNIVKDKDRSEIDTTIINDLLAYE